MYFNYQVELFAETAKREHFHCSRGTARMERRKLSPRESEILELMTEGLTNRQIALALGISPKTVATYIARIYMKLGVSCRAAAVAAYFKEKYAPEE